MSATYYHYTVWAEEDDEDSEGAAQRVDPREAFDDPFLQEESEVEDEADTNGESGAETTDNQESTDEGDSDEGDRLKVDGEIYFFVFDQIFPETDGGTTQNGVLR